MIGMSFTTTIESNAGSDSSNSASPHLVLLTVATDTIALRGSLENFRWILIGLCSLAVAVSGTILFWVVGRGVRPVERLAADIDRCAKMICPFVFMRPMPRPNWSRCRKA